MARHSNIIDEYLVSLGFQVNRGQLNEVDRALKNIRDATSVSTASLTKNIAIAAGGITTLLAAASVGIGAFVNNVAQADLQTELFARRMWITKDAARSLETTLDSLGYSLAEIYDIAGNPELTSQFLRLRQEIQQIEAPKELDTLLRGFREVTFEFSRFRALIAQGSRWVSYWFLTDFNEQITTLKASFQSLNDYIKANLPQIARTISRWFGNVLQVANSVIWAFKGLYNVISNVFGSLGTTAKVGLGGVLAAFLAFNNPALAAIGLITSFLLLLEDFYAFSIGGNSAFEGFWSSLQNGLLNGFNTENLSESFQTLLESVSTLGQSVSELISNIASLFGEDFTDSALIRGFDLLSKAADTFLTLLNFIVTALDTVVNGVNDFFFGEKNKQIYADIDDVKSEATSPTYTREIGDYLETIPYRREVEEAETPSQLKDVLERYGVYDSLPEGYQQNLRRAVGLEEQQTPLVNKLEGVEQRAYADFGVIGLGIEKVLGKVFGKLPEGLGLNTDKLKLEVDSVSESLNLDNLRMGIQDTTLNTVDSTTPNGVFTPNTNNTNTLSSVNSDNRTTTNNIVNNVYESQSGRSTAASLVDRIQQQINNKSTKGWLGTQNNLQDLQNNLAAITGGG